MGASALRWLGFMLAEGEAGQDAGSIDDRVFLAGGVFSCVLFGTFPQLFAGIFEAARGFGNLIP
jgi:hypothetical protein